MSLYHPAIDGIGNRRFLRKRFTPPCDALAEKNPDRHPGIKPGVNDTD
jgi:hypothetical protein